MRARALFAATVGVLLLAVAVPAAAKVVIDEVRISGPGLDRGLRISAPAAQEMWDSGVDMAGGLDDTRPDSVEGLGLAPAELGPRYVITYRFIAGRRRPDIVRQELYPYAKGGPVTHTPPGQRIAEGLPWGGAITAGWYQSSPEFLRYLVEQGLPETNPVVPTERGSDPDTAPAATWPLWAWLALALAGLVALGVASQRLRRRVHAVPATHH
ncbi:MAG TPA: hypothetical protein VFT80_06770 [Actinomycetota bacterium]|nr:hypothetical protein [Actinomycetota bacterium]